MGTCSSRPDDLNDAVPVARPGAKSDPRSALMLKGPAADASTGGDTVRNFKSGNHHQSRSSPAIANMLLGEAGALAAESFKSRASSMSEVAFTAAGVAGEAFDDALNAVLRDASPHHLTNGSNKQRKGSNRHNTGAGTGAAAAATSHTHGGSRGQRQQNRGGSTSSNNRAGKQSANDTLPPGATASPRQSESGPACGAAAPFAKPQGSMSGLSSAISTPLPDVSAQHHHHHRPGSVTQAPPARRSNPGGSTAQRSPSRVERACTGLGGVGGESRRSRPTVTFEGVSEPSGPRVMVRERNKSRLGVVSQPGFPPDSGATSPATSDCGNGGQYQKSHSNHNLGRAPARGSLAPPPLPPALPMAMQLPAAKGGASEPGLWVLRRTGNVRHKYILADALGRGQFGSVCVAMERASGERWACKSVSKRRVQGMHDFSMADVLREVEVLYTVGGHPGVVGLREVYEDEEELHLIMELCQGGDWFERLINFGRYTEAEAATTIRSVLEALSYCHSLGVMHRDIKPENIMFVDRTETSAVKLTDFGLAAMFTEGGPPLTEVLGSAYYVAPEVLREAYSKEADVWSTGVVLFIALGGYAPFDGANEREVFAKILHEPLQFKDSSWGHISMDAKDVLSRMLTKDPRQRASIKELLAHPWFQTCAGTLTPGGTPASPQHGPAEGAALRQSVALDPGMSQRIPKGSISKAVQQAIKRGKQVKAVPDAVVARLQQFSAMNAFKRQARRVLATYLPEEEVVGLMQVFKDMDKDGDGLLTVRELQQGLAERGVSITDNNAKLMLARADLDGDGAIDYAEFLAATLHLARLERDERLYRAFRFFDKDGSGFITRDELEGGLQHLGRVNVERILAEVDKDGDGRICYTEFCDMLRHDHDPYISVFAGENPLESHPSWGAWGEATGSGRLLLAMPPDSLAPSRCMSLANSRQPSGNERTSYASLGAVSIRRSLGGNLLFGSRNARASGTGAHHPASRPSQMGGRPSLGGGTAARPSLAGSSRFGSMRVAAMVAAGTHPGDISGRSSARTVASNDSSTLPIVPIRSGILAQAAAHAAAAVAAAAAAQRLLHHEAMLEVVTELEGSATSSAFGGPRTSPLNLEHVAAQLDSPQGAADGSRPNSARRPANARSVTEGGISENHAPLPSPFALPRNALGGKPAQQPAAPPTAWGDEAHVLQMPPRPPAPPAHQRSPKDTGAPGRAATASPNSRAPRHNNNNNKSAAAEQPGETAAQLQARKHAAALRLYARGAHQETGAAVGSTPDSPTAHGHGPATPDSPASSLWQQIKAMGGMGCDDGDGPVSLGQMMDKAKGPAAPQADSKARSPAPVSPMHPVRASASVIAASETDEASVARRVQSASVASPYNNGRAKPRAV